MNEASQTAIYFDLGLIKIKNEWNEGILGVKGLTNFHSIFQSEHFGSVFVFSTKLFSCCSSQISVVKSEKMSRKLELTQNDQPKATNQKSCVRRVSFSKIRHSGWNLLFISVLRSDFRLVLRLILLHTCAWIAIQLNVLNSYRFAMFFFQEFFV